MQFDYRTAGKVICRLRKERGLSQDVLSGLAGISRTHLSMIEGAQKHLNLDTFWRLALALDLAPSRLLHLIEQELSAPDGPGSARF